MICRGGDIARGPRRRRDAGGATPSGVKKRPDCKPGYVDTIFSFFVAEGLRYGNPTPCRPVIYLCRAVARGLKRSTPRQMGEQPIRSSRPQGPEQRSTAGILDLATHQTVRRANSRWRPVGSYPAFSPLPRWGGGASSGKRLPRHKWGGCFLSRCLHGCPCLSVRKDGALRCPDFPHAHAPMWERGPRRAVRPLYIVSCSVFQCSEVKAASAVRRRRPAQST